MEYKFRSDIKPKDLWQLAMLRTYKGFLGVINIVFTVSVIFMTIRLFGEANIIFKILMILLCLLFPVIQPAAVYGKSVKQLEALPKNLELAFDSAGIHVSCDGQSQDIPWKNITNAIKQKNMIIILADNRHGYMISDRELGDKKEEVYKFVCERITKERTADISDREINNV